MENKLTKHDIAVKIIKNYINDLKEFGEGYSIEHQYDAAVSMAMMTKIISIKEKLEFDKEVNAVLYGE